MRCAAGTKALGIDQPKISALMNGRLAGFSTDRLLRFVVALGHDIQITAARERARRPARIKVGTA